MPRTRTAQSRRTTRALEPGLGEVRQRVGAGPAQRGGDEDEQHEVAHGVADREPQHVGAEGVDQSGDAEERGGREVLAADRGGVPARRDGAAGDVEVAGGAGQAQPERTDPERHQADQGDGDDAVRRVHRRADQVGEVAFDPLGVPDVVARRPARPPGRPARPGPARAAAPGHTRTSLAAGTTRNSSGSPPSRTAVASEHRQRRAAAARASARPCRPHRARSARRSPP